MWRPTLERIRSCFCNDDLSHSDGLSAQVAGVSATCALAAIVGSVMFFGPLYWAPIARLSDLHDRIIRRLDRFASPRTSGAVMGRMGEDFSDLRCRCLAPWVRYLWSFYRPLCSSEAQCWRPAVHNRCVGGSTPSDACYASGFKVDSPCLDDGCQSPR